MRCFWAVVPSLLDAFITELLAACVQLLGVRSPLAGTPCACCVRASAAACWGSCCEEGWTQRGSLLGLLGEYWQQSMVVQELVFLLSRAPGSRVCMYVHVPGCCALHHLCSAAYSGTDLHILAMCVQWQPSRHRDPPTSCSVEQCSVTAVLYSHTPLTPAHVAAQSRHVATHSQLLVTRSCCQEGTGNHNSIPGMHVSQ